MMSIFRPSASIGRRQRSWRTGAALIGLASLGLWVRSQTAPPADGTGTASIPAAAAPGQAPAKGAEPIPVKAVAERTAPTPAAPDAVGAARVRAAEASDRPRPPPSDGRALVLSLSASPSTIDSTSFASNGMVFHLGGVRPIEPGRTCAADAATRWPCGAKATAAFRQMVANSVLTCRPLGGPSATGLTASCTKEGRDVATALVASGWAIPTRAAAAGLAGQLALAQTGHAGIWLYMPAAAPAADVVAPPASPPPRHHRKRH